MGTKERILLFILVCSLCQFCISASYPDSDTILQGQELRDWDHLISANRKFRLHFFSPSHSTPKNRYLGISFNTPDSGPQHVSNKKVAWVANRNTPIPDASGTLTIDSNGTLKIMYGGGGNPIVLNSVPTANNASATLLDSGNFVLRELNSDRVLWQSFDYPTNTLLPGMKLGINFKTGHVWSLISWISLEVPAPGSFTFGVDPNKTNQLIIWWQGRVYWTSGPWQGNGSFEFAPRLSHDEGYRSFRFVSNENEKYFMYSASKNRSFYKYVMDPLGVILEGGSVAAFAACSFDDGFEDTAGCVKDELPECRSSSDWFERRYGYVWGDGLKFPNLSLFDCQNECLKNCSCVAYGSISANGTGCETWRRGMSFYEIDSYSSREFYILPSKRAKWWIWLIIAIAGVLVIVLFCSFCYLLWRKFKGGTKEEEEITLLCELAANRAHSSKSKKRKLANEAKETQELQLFDFESITASTDNFAAKNMLGKGGFGPVYKGKLNGQEVAIKRLSRSSGQGVVEFKNELALVAKLQHNNLVRVIGCCIKREEKILVYEYMPNKSLDFFLFDPSKKNILDWKTRFNIIEGIAQGLIYLHKYSRLRIIHRDLKAGNILLDGEMNPKISDFGMARIFKGNDSKANTNKVVGTHGYMSPEYLMEGIFSVKSDVFSFGVLLLEIIRGEKNNSCYHPEHPRNLTGYAWELWIEGRGLELVDPSLNDTYQSSEVLRCVHVGLLCLQENPNDRPTMLDVVSMIFNESVLLPTPKRPAFFIGRSSQEANIPRRTSENCSLNNVTISGMETAR